MMSANIGSDSNVSVNKSLTFFMVFFSMQILSLTVEGFL